MTHDLERLLDRLHDLLVAVEKAAIDGDRQDTSARMYLLAYEASKAAELLNNAAWTEQPA